MRALSTTLRHIFALTLLTVAAVTTVSSNLVGVDGLRSCAVANLQAKAPAGMTIVQASIVPADGSTPAYCQVDATVSTPGNSVAVRLGLPETWNRKFYFSGVGLCRVVRFIRSRPGSRLCVRVDGHGS